MEFAARLHDALQLIEEPAVNLRKVVNLIHRVAGTQRFADDVDAFVGGLAECLVEVGDNEFPVLHKAVHPLPYHAEALLDNLLEAASDAHHFAHALHGGADFAIHAVELSEVPAREFADDIVDTGFEEGAGGAGDGIANLPKAVAETDFGCHGGQRIARSLGSKGRRTTQASIDFDDEVLLAHGVVSKLDVALAHNAQVANDADGKLVQLGDVLVRKRLGGGDDDALARVDAEGVEVLHRADGDAVVVAVAHHLKLNFLPSLEALLHENLRGERKALLSQPHQFLFIVAEAAAQSAEGVCRTDDDGVTQLAGSALGVVHRLHSLALDGVDVYLCQTLVEQLAILGVDDGLHGGTQHADIVFFQHATLKELHAAVQRRLSAKGQQDSIGLLLLDDTLHEVGSDGKEIDLVGNALGRLHGGDVRVDEHRLHALLAHSLKRLRARIVKFTRFANFQRATTQQQHLLRQPQSTLARAHGLRRPLAAGHRKDSLPVECAALRLRTELEAVERLAVTADALARAVVDILERHAPPFGQRGSIDGIAVILRGDITVIVGQAAYGVVVATMAIRQGRQLGSRSKGEELAAEADAHNGLLALQHRSDAVDGIGAKHRIARAIGEPKDIGLHGINRSVERHAGNLVALLAQSGYQPGRTAEVHHDGMLAVGLALGSKVFRFGM